MDSIRKSWDICLQNIRKWPSNPRIFVVVLLMAVMVNMFEAAVKGFSQAVRVPATPWIFPFLTSYYYALMFIMLGIVLLFCDAPFFDDQQPYMMIRSGKTCWVAGQVLYIFLASAIYFLFIFLLSFLLFIPNLTVSFDWGKIFGTLAQTDARNQFQIPMAFPYKIMQMYTPLQATGLSLFMCWMVGSFLGLLMFAVNMHLNRAIGAVVASGLVLFEMVVYSVNPLKFFSPVSWASLDIIDPTHTTQLPPTEYAIGLLVGFSALFIVIAVVSIRKKNVDVLPQI